MIIERLTVSEALVAKAALGTALGAALFIAVRRVAASCRSDPWTDDIDASVRGRDAVPVCTNCLAPQADRHWFCPHCSFPAGEYVALLPFVQNFALGEAFRRGVSGPAEERKGARALAWLASAMTYRAFAPIYWFWLVRKQNGKPVCSPTHRPWNPDEND